MTHDDMITIHANILQVTDAAVLVNCDDREIWLPLSQIDVAGEKGDTNVPISLPEWLAAEPADEQSVPSPENETIGTPHTTNPHTCLDCGHMLDGENDTQAEECASCSQSGSGETDNWTPRRECRTCAHSHDVIDMPPCKGCALNVMPEHRGDEERWECVDAPRESSVAPADEADSEAGDADNARGGTEQAAHASV